MKKKGLGKYFVLHSSYQHTMNSQWDQKVFRGVSIGGAIILPELKDDLIP